MSEKNEKLLVFKVPGASCVDVFFSVLRDNTSISNFHSVKNIGHEANTV